MINKVPPTTDTLQLEDNRLISENRILHLTDLPDPTLKSKLSIKPSTPMIERLWKCAISDLESNIVSTSDGRYFAAGDRGMGWGGKMFVRDTSLAGILGLNIISPDTMLENQHLMRKRFFERIWNTPQDHVFGWENLPEKIEHLGLSEYSSKYKFNPPMRCTDDVIWIWCTADLLTRIDAPKSEWKWFYETGERCFNEFYNYFFDPNDGLFFGQSIFMDIGWEGYPESFGRTWPQSYDTTPESYKRAVELKATSTNSAYVIAMDKLSEAAHRLNRKDKYKNWKGRAENLRSAIRDNLRNDDGTFAIYKHKDGDLEPRQDALGTALIVLSKTVKGDEAVDAICNYPITGWGVPLIHPHFDNDQTYHNKCSWPFVDAFFLWAREEALKTNNTQLHMALLARCCLCGDTFFEFINHIDGTPGGKSAQLWSAASFIGRCERAGLIAKNN